MNISDLLTQIAKREATRTEATLQADIRQLVLTAPLSLSASDVVTADLETPVGVRRRIDIQVGSCLIEVKRDLNVGKVLADAIEQLGGYLKTRQTETGGRYVGILTDGADWLCLSVQTSAECEPRIVSKISVSQTNLDVDGFLVWLEGVLATAQDIPATPLEIERRLGAQSSAHALDRETLADLFSQNRNHPAVLMKRQLWGRLLKTALGTQFDDNDELFVEHTYLVNTAEIIAHALVGFELESIHPASLLSGAMFEESGISGVVEADFFDWVAHVPGGDSFVRSLARRVGRFQWRNVGGDVLKVLYESVITAPTRKKLGEYYTPDWLADRMVATVVDLPLERRVLDPACGSGTFLFHAVRRYLSEADKAGVPSQDALVGLTSHVLGMDLHPVAVTLARVTYLLAIGRDRLINPERGPIQIPVYLGDAVQWKREAEDLFTGGHLVIETDDEQRLFESELRFPDELLDDPARFGQLVEAMTNLAGNRKSPAVPKLTGIFQRFAIPTSARETLKTTFETLCKLHDEGRDHIWSYYVRNLARPWWLALEHNRVDILIGNPPWLAYRFMSPSMQETFRLYSEERGLWQGAKVATHQDLSGLFLVRSVERYLRVGGHFAFVMPNAVVDRGQFTGLRSGQYRREESNNPVMVSFGTAWDLRRIRPHFFPRGSAVLFGERVSSEPRALPSQISVWSGRVPEQNATWHSVKDHLEQIKGETSLVSEDSTSPWSDRFRQGATIVPRMLLCVTRREVGPLGMSAGKIGVRSLKRSNDKKPWKDLPELVGSVEREFIKPVLFGEGVLPYRIAETFEAVIPRDKHGLMSGESDRLDTYEGLAAWWRQAETVWENYRSSERLTLLERLDYQGGLRQQFPVQAERIVYNGSGMHLVAARLNNPRVLIDNSLYWATATSPAEALYLCAVLNTSNFTELARPFMSYGKDERHFHKHIWQIPILLYDPDNDLHVRLSACGATLETAVSHLQIRDIHFAAVRRDVRNYISTSEAGREAEELVAELLS